MTDAALPAELRRARIAERVREDGILRVAEAAAWFGVSEVTIRSDLGLLEGAGLVRRVHGSALPVLAGPREEPLERVSARDAAAKRAIGRRAASLVGSGTSVLLDVGSTTLAVAHALVDRVERGDLDELVVVTNGLSIALALEAAVPRITVVLTGGTLRPLQHSLVDPGASESIAGLHVDLAVLGCNGVDAEGRVTNLNLAEAEVKRAMLAASATHLVVAESAKLGARHLGTIGLADASTTIVTAGPWSDAASTAASALAALGVRVIRADG
ncbi:DeoR/GlpR family DNA-binding transcription regulator [Protaetiibacter mangrovi]|uniref:DeoR/GlpR family DNA-binding transcription regulator n=1 Tax=Protaetiibacter mangrovi TaxID=2970926 RepID=A0ABT1ZDI2_9MICO|nr:DeoR/GlpR family DNA-binding transcription regulator [Protaetiibacter mangrovi]MCS0498763.1 DeoR/GlpR family DNA-binding transcription regulator [Protaetiibacter mangrovi]TPX03140.1 DeoR/GlpR transcriptional regulator [Schumannella luteola]